MKKGHYDQMTEEIAKLEKDKEACQKQLESLVRPCTVDSVYCIPLSRRHSYIITLFDIPITLHFQNIFLSHGTIVALLYSPILFLPLRMNKRPSSSILRRNCTRSCLLRSWKASMTKERHLRRSRRSITTCGSGAPSS